MDKTTGTVSPAQSGPHPTIAGPNQFSSEGYGFLGPNYAANAAGFYPTGYAPIPNTASTASTASTANTAVAPSTTPSTASTAVVPTASTAITAGSGISTNTQPTVSAGDVPNQQPTTGSYPDANPEMIKFFQNMQSEFQKQYSDLMKKHEDALGVINTVVKQNENLHDTVGNLSKLLMHNSQAEPIEEKQKRQLLTKGFEEGVAQAMRYMGFPSSTWTQSYQHAISRKPGWML